MITPEEGLRASRQIDAIEWMECTAMEKVSADNVVQSMALHGIHHSRTRGEEDRCVLL